MVGEARDPEGDAGPLDGLTVLDASRVLVGQFCTMQLGDLDELKKRGAIPDTS